MKTVSTLFLFSIILFSSCRKSEFVEPPKKNAIQVKPVDTSLLSISYNGIGGYNLDNQYDKIISYDYGNTGLNDYLLLYRPGSKICWIMQNNNGVFSPVQQYSNGFNGYDLTNLQDLVISFDYDHTGKKDDLIFYRPGMKVVWIFTNNHNGTFTKVFSSSNGIGGFLFDQNIDKMVAYDYTGTGKKDHLICYRPGSGKVTILKNQSGVFTAVYTSTTGIGGFLLNSPSQREEIIPYDYNYNGNESHLFVYSTSAEFAPQPGGGNLNYNRINYKVLQNVSGTFSSVQGQQYDLTYNNLFFYSYYVPFKDRVIEYTPGVKLFGLRQFQTGPTGPFPYLYQSTNGVAGYNLDQTYDRIITFDYTHSGTADHFIIYRPKDKTITIMKENNLVFTQLL